MDYGKLAYLQVEDLKRLVSSISASPGSEKTLITQYASQEKGAFSGNYISGPVLFRCSQQSAVTAEISLSAELTGESAAKCRLILNGVEAESRDIIMTQAPQQYTLKFALSSLPEGSHELRFWLTSDSGGSIYNVCVQLRGTGVNELASQCKVSVIEQGYPYKISFGDGRRVIVYAMAGGGLEPLIESIERQKYCSCAVVFYEEQIEQYDILYFFIEEGSLYMTVYNVYTDADNAYTYLIDSDVSDIAAVKINEGGAALCYTRGKDIYFSIISRSPDDSVPANHYSAQKSVITERFSAKPGAVSEVLGLGGGFAFCVSGSDGSNILYKSCQPRVRDSHSTMQLGISADVA